MKGKTIYTASRIFTGERWLTDHAIVCEDGIISELIPLSSIKGNTVVEGYTDHFIAPAFIDLQIYGAAGRLLAVYPTIDSVIKLVEYCRNSGTAYCLPTVATNTKEVFYKSIDAVRNYLTSGGKGIPGIHLEGPWINKEKRGAHIKSLIHGPTGTEVSELLEYGKGVIRMITLAPEVCSPAILNQIAGQGIIISAGHSNIDYLSAMNSFQQGVTTVTHLYNAMSPLHHRMPGLVGAAFDHDRVMASIIPDGYHVDFSAIRIAKSIMKERLFAITDAVTDTDKGAYQHTFSGDKYEAGGILSGSALDMRKALYNLVNEVGIETGEALRMCSLYPARSIGIDKMAGMIEKGFKADLVLLSDDIKNAKLL